MEDSNKPEKIERKDRTVLYACLGAVAAGIVIGVLFYMFLMTRFSMIDVEDVNGPEDTSLATVTAEEVLAAENSYSATMLRSGGIGSRTNVGGRLDEYDSDYRTVSARKISGVLTIQASNVDADELTLEIDTTLQSGNMEVFILVDGALAQQAEVNKTQIITLTDIAGKDVLVKIGAESAQMEISVKRTY